MKKISVIALILVVAMLPLGVFGCQKGEKVTYNTTVTIYSPDSDSPILDEVAVVIECDADYTPTVLDVIVEACQQNDIDCETSDDALDIASIDGYAESSEDSTNDAGAEGKLWKYWDYTLDGKTAFRAGNTTIKDGAVIEYTYIVEFVAAS